MRCWIILVFTIPILLYMILPGVSAEENVVVKSWLGFSGFRKNVTRLLTSLPSKSDFLAKLPDYVAEAGKENVTEKCVSQTDSWLRALLREEQFAMDMYDACGKPESGIAAGNLEWFGSYSMCRSLVDHSPYTFKPNYCVTRFAGLPEATWLPGGSSPYLGVCVPDGCSNQDIHKLAELAVKRTNDVTLNVEQVRCDGEPDVPVRAGDIVAMIVTFLLGLLLISATLVDVIGRCAPKKTHDDVTAVSSTDVIISGDVNNVVMETVVEGVVTIEAPPPAAKQTTSTDKKARLLSVLKAFSVLGNAEKILDTSTAGNDIKVLHGIRVISMFWVIAGHSYFFRFGLFDNRLHMLVWAASHWTFSTIGNATFSVDTFFLLSGLLVGYLMSKSYQNSSNQHCCLFVLWSYLHRYLRLTPVYALLLMYHCTLLQHVVTPPITSVGYSLYTCGGWFLNMLYIQSPCMGWTWYLAVDMQLFIVSPIFILTFHRWRKAGICVMIGSGLGCMVLTFIMVYLTNYNEGSPVGMVQPPPIINPDFDTVYKVTWPHMAVYLTGIATGMLLLYTRTTAIKIHMAVKVVGWILAWVVALSVLYGPSGQIAAGKMFSHFNLAIYASLSRFLWGAAVAWVIIACCQGFGGPVTKILEWKFWIPLSRITYCAYLSHPLWAFLHIEQSTRNVHYGDWQMLYIVVGDVFFTYIISFGLSVAFEAPFLHLMKIAFKNKK